MVGNMDILAFDVNPFLRSLENSLDRKLHRLTYSPLQLVPENAGQDIIDHLEVTQSYLKSMISTIAASSKISSTNHFNELDPYLKKMLTSGSLSRVNLDQSLKRRWLHGTSAFLIFDELSKNPNDLKQYGLEIRKVLLDGAKVEDQQPSARISEIAMKIMSSKSRDQIIFLLTEYVNQPSEAK